MSISILYKIQVWQLLYCTFFWLPVPWSTYLDLDPLVNTWGQCPLHFTLMWFAVLALGFVPIIFFFEGWSTGSFFYSPVLKKIFFKVNWCDRPMIHKFLFNFTEIFQEEFLWLIGQFFTPGYLNEIFFFVWGEKS